MEKLGFWRNHDLAQIRAINQAADELGELQWNTAALRQQLTSLRHLVADQQLEIHRLGAALQAVCDVLVDLDLIEGEALCYRVDAALAEVAEEPASAPPSPFDRVPADEPAEHPDVQCASCQRHVPAAAISFTDRGPICDACLAAHE